MDITLTAGSIYELDLGPRTAAIASGMTSFDPDLALLAGDRSGSVRERTPLEVALSEIAKRYIAVGGLKQTPPCVYDRIAEGAHAKAWMALAISKTGDPNLVIW